jgi:hypothetical protein
VCSFLTVVVKSNQLLEKIKGNSWHDKGWPADSKTQKEKEKQNEKSLVNRYHS